MPDPQFHVATIGSGSANCCLSLKHGPLAPASHNSVCHPTHTEPGFQLPFVILHAARSLAVPAWSCGHGQCNPRPETGAQGSGDRSPLRPLKPPSLSSHHILTRHAGARRPGPPGTRPPPLGSPVVPLEGQLVTGLCFPFRLWTLLLLSCFEVCFPAHGWSDPGAK